MVTKMFYTAEVDSLIMGDEEPEYDDPNQPIVEGSDEEYVCLEKENENGYNIHIIIFKNLF